MAQPNRSPTRLPVRSIPSAQPTDEDGKRRSTILHRRNVSAVPATAMRHPSSSEGPSLHSRSKSRPLNGTSSSKKEEEQIPARSISSAANDGGRKAMPPPSTRLARSKSVRTVESAQESSKTSTLRSHTRTRSTIETFGLPRVGVATKKQPEPVKSPKALLSRDDGSRPASSASTVSRGSTDTARTASRTGTAASHSRQASTSIPGQQRVPSTSVRSSRASSITSTASAAAKAPSRYGTLPAGGSARPTSSASTSSRGSYHHATLPASGLARPAFSTLQQHFSPRKTTITKPPVPTSKSLFSEPPSTSVGSGDVFNLQTRLLQLLILYEDAEVVQKQWEQSAQQALMKKFKKTAEQYNATRSKEHGLQERVNLAALQAWDTGIGLAEKMSILATLLHELPVLVDPDGRYTRLVQAFERWVAWVESIHDARDRDGGGVSSLYSFPARDKKVQNNQIIEPISASWKSEHAALTRKIAGLVREAQDLDVPGEGSTAATVVRALKEMLRNMVDELRTMEKIEFEVGESEKAWVEREVRGIEDEIESVLKGQENEVVAWR